MPKIDASGPLTDRQRMILRYVALGNTHKYIAEVMHLSRVTISEEMRRVVSKLGVANSAEACALHGQYVALTDHAAQLRKDVLPEPLGEAEEHVNHVLEAYARALDAAAAEMLP